jgi:hypothetical protein
MLIKRGQGTLGTRDGSEEAIWEVVCQAPAPPTNSVWVRNEPLDWSYQAPDPQVMH